MLKEEAIVGANVVISKNSPYYRAELVHHSQLPPGIVGVITQIDNRVPNPFIVHWTDSKGNRNNNMYRLCDLEAVNTTYEIF